MFEALSALIAEETHLRTIAAAVLAAPPVPPQHAPNGSLDSKKLIPCGHCQKKGHSKVRCFKKHPHLLAELRVERAASHRGTAAISFVDHPPSAPSVAPPSTTPAAPQSSAPVTFFTLFSAYMSGASLASTSA
uniref:Uncharacterized protein n=1 Tax=Arundo donax TaxID=35708 RepID=A0A0A8XYH2_ARUDO